MCKGVDIRKVENPKEEWEFQHNIVDKRSSLIRVGFAQAVSEMEKEMESEAMATAINTGKLAPVVTAAKWTDAAFSGLNKAIKIVIDESAESSARFLPTVEPDKVYNKKSNDVELWIKQYSKNRLSQMDEQTRKIVKDAIREKREKNLTTRQTAQFLKERIGLNHIQSRAMTNLETRLEKAGKTPAQIEKEKEKYKKQAIKYRSKMIAATEATDAANYGQLEVWNQAIDQGIMDKKTKKEWVVTPTDGLCDSCRAMDGQRRMINELFIDPTGIFDSVYSPSLHPWCRCSMKLIFF